MIPTLLFAISFVVIDTFASQTPCLDQSCKCAPGVTEANTRRIENGMPIGKVHDIFGRDEDEFESGDGGAWFTWVGKDGVADVTTDEEGIVDSVHFTLKPPEPGATVENFHRLRAGMSHAQVEAILGQLDEETDEGEGHPYELWNRKDITIYLWFGDDNRLEEGRAYVTVPGASTSKAIPLPAVDNKGP